MNLCSFMIQWIMYRKIIGLLFDSQRQIGFKIHPFYSYLHMYMCTVHSVEYCSCQQAIQLTAQSTANCFRFCVCVCRRRPFFGKFH